MLQQVGVGVLDRLGGGVEAREHEAHADETQFVGALQGQDRGLASFYIINRLEPGDLRGDAFHLGFGFRRLDEDHAGPGFPVGVTAPDGLVEPKGPPGIGAGGNDELRLQAIAGCRGGADLGHVLLHGDDALAPHMAAALGPGLVLEDHPRRPHLDQRLHHVNNIQGAAEAGVAVDDHADRHRAADPPGHVENFALGQQTEIRFAQMAGAHRVAAEHHGMKTGALGEFRAEDVPDPCRDHDLRGLDQRVFLRHRVISHAVGSEEGCVIRGYRKARP